MRRIGRKAPAVDALRAERATSASRPVTSKATPSSSARSRLTGHRGVPVPPVTGQQQPPPEQSLSVPAVDASAGLADQAVTGAVAPAMPAVPLFGHAPFLRDHLGRTAHTPVLRREGHNIKLCQCPPSSLKRDGDRRKTADTMRSAEMRTRRSQALPKICRRAEDALPYSTLD